MESVKLSAESEAALSMELAGYREKYDLQMSSGIVPVAIRARVYEINDKLMMSRFEFYRRQQCERLRNDRMEDAIKLSQSL